MPVLIPTGGQRLAVDGVDLANYGAIVFSKAPLMGTPPKRSKNVVVPGRHGTIRTPRKRFDEHDVTLKLLILGSQPDGSIPSGSSTEVELYARADALMALFPSRESVTLTRTMPDGSTRQCVAEVIDKTDTARTLGDRPLMAELTVALTIPGAFWFDEHPVNHIVTGTTGVVDTLDEFAGATAPMEDLVLTFGPCNNPQISQGAAFVQYNGVISTGRQLTINTGTWSLGPGTGSPWTPDVSLVTYSPGPRWFALDPSLPLDVTFTHTGGGSATCTISGSRAYLSA